MRCEIAYHLRVRKQLLIGVDPQLSQIINVATKFSLTAKKTYSPLMVVTSQCVAGPEFHGQGAGVHTAASLA